MSDFTKQAMLRLKTSMKGKTKTVKDKDYRDGFLTGCRLVWNFKNLEISKYKVRYYTSNLISKKPKKKNYENLSPEINNILEKICTKLNVSVDQIKSSSRLKKFVYARTIAINSMLDRAGMNYSIVGNILGKRNHSTIMYHHNQKNLKIGYWKPQNDIWNIYEQINKEL